MVMFTAALSAQDFNDGVFNYTVIESGISCEVHSMVQPGSLTDVVIPATADQDLGFGPLTHDVIAIGDGAFSAGSKGVGRNPDNAAIVTVSLPTSVTMFNGAYQFRDNPNLTTINLENIVHTGSNAFASCKGITGAIDLASCTTLGNYTFVFCHGITAINAPNLVTINDGNFYDMDSLINVDIPASVTSIGNICFGRGAVFEAVKLNWADPSTVSVGATNFFRSENFATTAVKIYVPIDTEELYEAHEVWGQFPDVNIIEGDIPPPSNDPKVGDQFVEGNFTYTISNITVGSEEVSCGQLPSGGKTSGTKDSSGVLTAISIPASVTSGGVVYTVTAIAANGFIGNTVVTSVALPASVTLLNTNAFSGAINLETINLENIITVASQNAFFNCPKLTTANLAAVTDIGNFAFHGFGDSTLSSISIPSAVNINKAAFRTTAISSIDIPESVETIGDVAFMDCVNLTEIQVNWTDALDIPVITPLVVDDPATTEIDETAGTFGGLTPASITLYVPAGTAALYEAADVWTDFTIVEGTLGVSDVEKALGVKLYPNPTNGIVNIKNSNNTDLDITVYDVNGRSLLKTTNSRIDISNFSAGLYIFRIKTDQGQLVKRMLKN